MYVCITLIDIFVASINSGKAIDMGRLANSDIRVNDITISRHHARIRNNKGDYYLEDANSKFGTLMVAREPIEILRKGNVIMQINQTRVKLNMYPNLVVR
jgi:pSer/pThr/pTyr-binding forkhead associated (FHA) protein